MDTNLFLLLTDDYAVCHFCPQWSEGKFSHTENNQIDMCVLSHSGSSRSNKQRQRGGVGESGGDGEFVGKSLGDSFFKGKTTILFGVVLRIFVSFSRHFFRVYVFVIFLKSTTSE